MILHKFMYENMRQSPILNMIKSAWPSIYRVINSITYLIITTIRNGIKSAVDQIKGSM